MTEFICPDCQYVGKPLRKKRGSTRVEFSMWLLFPLGLPYSIWRMLSRYNVCRHCGNGLLIDTQSAVGKKLVAKMEEDIEKRITGGVRKETAPLPIQPEKRVANVKPDQW